MKRRLVSFMLVIVMLVTMLPVTAFAAEPVAAIGADKYTTLQDAVNNADGKTVVMLDNVTDNTALQIPENTNVTLDMNGKTFKSMDGGSGNWMAIKVNRGATLTLTGNGKIVASCYGVYVNPGATFNLESGSIEVSGNGTYDLAVVVWNGTFNMSGGSLKGQKGVHTSNYWADNGEENIPTSTVSITGGSIEATGANPAAIATEGASDITVSGGTFNTDVSDYLAPGLALTPDGTVTTPLNYVSLGDSMTNGYGFTGYKQGEGANILTGAGMYGDAAYPMLFEEYLTEQGYAVKHTKLAPSGMRAEELNYLLDGRDMPTDVWGIDQLHHYTGNSDDAELKALFQNSITDADVITMGVGNASFGAYLVQYFTRMMGVMNGSLDPEEKVDLEEALAVLEPEQKAVVMNAYNQMLAVAKQYLPESVGSGTVAIDVQGLIDMMAYVSVSFLLNYEGALDRIVALNDDVDVVLVGLMNTTYGMEVTGEGFDPIPVGDIVGIMFDALNAYIAGLPTVKQAAGEWENATFYYAEMPDPEFIVQVFDDLEAAGWPADLNGLSGDVVRSRTIKSYNDNLREMIGSALGFTLPELDIDDVKDYEPDAGDQYSVTVEFQTQAAQYNGSNVDSLPLVKEYITATGDTLLIDVDANFSTVFASYIEKEISIAIYVALEEALVQSVDTLDITLDGLLGIADDIFGALGEMPEALDPSNGPGPKTIKDALVGWFTGSDTALAMCKIFAMFKVGDGMSVHPTPAAHEEIFESVKAAYDGKYTAKDETVKNVQYALSALKGFLEEYGPQAADQAYKLWVDMGYQELVDGYIAELTTAIDARYTHYTEVVLPALNGTVDALNAQKDELTAELTTLKDQLAAKKAELEKVLAEQEIPEITPPEFNIETELGNNQQTQVPENDCAGAGNVADELAAAVADLEHAIAVVEALIADVTADIEDMVALATEIAEGVATLEKTLADVAAAAQDLKDAVDAVVTVLTDDSAKAVSKTFMKAFNAAREAALIAADALELIVKTVNDDFAAVEGSITALENCAKALADKFDADKEAILGKIMADIPEDAMMIVGGSIMLIQQTLEENKEAIMAGLDAAKNEALTKLTAEKDKVLADLAIEKAKLEAEYGPKIDEAKKKLDAKRVEINNEIQTRLDNLNTDAQIKIDALKTDAQLKIDALNVELQGYMNELNGLAADASAEVRAAVQAQIDRVNADIAAVNADLACAIDHVNAELKAAHDAMVAEVNRIYNNAITELQTIYDNLVKAYDDAVKNLQDAADEAIKNLQDAYNEAVKDLTDAADKAIQDLIDAANKELDKLGELGDTLSGIIDGILDAIHGDIAGAQQAISGILNGVQDSVADLGNALVDLGIDTVNALVDEVTNVINDMLYQATHADLELSNVSSYIALGDGTAVSAGYAEKLAAQLEEEYGVTNFKNYAATSNTVGAEVAAVATREGIADADLITIGFGNVTLLDNAIANAMSDSPVAYDWAELVGEDLVPYVEAALAEAYAEVSAAGMDEEMTAMVNAIVEGFAYGAVEYAIELPALIAAIREVNADAVIVVVGQYNPMEDVVLDLGGDTLDLSEYIDYFVDAVAVHGIGYSVISGDAIFVEAPDVDTDNTDMNWSILDLGKLAYNHFDSLNPSESGDVYIANQILGALNITHVVDATLLGDVTLDGKVNAEDVTALMAHLVGTQPLTDARALLNGDVDANNKLSANDVTVLLGYLVGTVPALPAL